MSPKPQTSSTLNFPSCRPDETDAAGAAHPKQSDAACAMHSTAILRGQKAVEIIHNGLSYRLQATRLGKLILTK
jgi:hemin uptake protein HemP